MASIYSHIQQHTSKLVMSSMTMCDRFKHKVLYKKQNLVALQNCQKISKVQF